MSVITVKHPTGIINGTIQLDGSKSISNRVLVIRALSGLNFDIHQLGSSDDIQTMQRLLSQSETTYDAHHAGTTFRFLTAYLAIKEGEQILTGSERMKERPIGPLVDALRAIHCNIEYLEKEGYPPLKLHSPGDMSQVKEVKVKADISSQYITALLLIAPTLPNGLTIHLKGDLVSESYLKMTMSIIEQFGIKVDYTGEKIRIEKQSYSSSDYTVEADWSAASYYYSLVAIGKEGSSVRLKGLFEKSVQGDSGIAAFGKQIGVQTSWEGNDCVLTKCSPSEQFSYDFINQPDIAQTIAVICAARGISTDLSGLKTLRIKETDRIAALNTELRKVGSSFSLFSQDDNGEEHYTTTPLDWNDKVIPRFETYRDHRMPMSFAPLALIRPIQFHKPEVVSKSYPEYWNDLASLGFKISKESV